MHETAYLWLRADHRHGLQEETTVYGKEKKLNGGTIT